MRLINALFDTRFDQLISRQLLGVVYRIALGLHLLAGVITLLRFLASGGMGILVGLVVVPLVTLLAVLALRVVFEALAVYFRAAEDVRALRINAEAARVQSADA